MTANVNSAAMKLRSRQNVSFFFFKCIKFHNLLINKIITIKILNFSSFIRKSIRINILLTRLSRSSNKLHSKGASSELFREQKTLRGDDTSLSLFLFFIHFTIRFYYVFGRDVTINLVKICLFTAAGASLSVSTKNC